MSKTKVLDDIRTQELINWMKNYFLNKNADISITSDEIDNIIDNAIEEAEEEAYGNKVAVPTFTSTIYYDGTEKTAVFNGYNPNKMTVTGNTAINVGNYTATFTLKQGFQWVDETTAPKEVAWSIQAEPVKTPLTVPTFTSTITYDGTEKTATFTGYDSGTMTVSGNTGTNAGTYTATFGIKDKSQYEWSDSTSADKTVTWTIGKATGSITLDKNSISLDSTTTSDTVTATIVGDGTLTATSSDSTVATVTKNGNTFTVSSVGDTGGTATITFSLAAGTNYTGASDTISVSVTGSVPQIVIGDTYSFGGFNWTAAEDLGDNAVCLQSQGMTSGTWPGYKLSKDYTETKDYGGANSYYADNIDGDNITHYDSTTMLWYIDYGSVEKTGQSYGSGLFLVSNSKAGWTITGQPGSGNYWSALKTAATNYSSFGANDDCSWLGTDHLSYEAWYVYSNGNINDTKDQSTKMVIAPAFNLDLTKVNIDSNNVITKK